jgi:hypothetical protein
VVQAQCRIPKITVLGIHRPLAVAMKAIVAQAFSADTYPQVKSVFLGTVSMGTAFADSSIYSDFHGQGFEGVGPVAKCLTERRPRHML